MEFTKPGMRSDDSIYVFIGRRLIRDYLPSFLIHIARLNYARYWTSKSSMNILPNEALKHETDSGLTMIFLPNVKNSLGISSRTHLPLVRIIISSIALSEGTRTLHLA